MSDAARQLLTRYLKKTGEDLSARAMVACFQLLLAYVQEQNRERKYTL